MSVEGGAKGTEMRLSLEVPPPIFNVYQRRRFVCVRWGLKRNLKLLRLSLNVPLQFVNMNQRRHFCRGGK